MLSYAMDIFDAVDSSESRTAGPRDMNFKVDPEFHRAFKTTASIRGMSMKELLESAVQCWLERYGDDQTRHLFKGNN